MAAYPPGMLSFLYNVLHDVEINEKFRYDEDEVMEYFDLTDDQRRIIKRAGKLLIDEREEAARDGRKMLTYKETLDIAKREFREWDEEVEELMQAVQEELEKGYGRFW